MPNDKPHPLLKAEKIAAMEQDKRIKPMANSDD